MISEPLIYPVLINFPYTPAPLGEPLDLSEYSLSLNFLDQINYPFASHVQFDENNNLFLTIDNNEMVTLNGCYCLSLNVGGNKYIINNRVYPAVESYLNLDASNEEGEFTFTSSKPIINPAPKIIQDEDGVTYVSEDTLVVRCDNLMNGPTVFLRPGEQPVGPDFNSTLIGSLADLTVFHPIISVDGVGHIIYVKLTEKYKEDIDVNQNNMPKATRSISELIKLMTEWRNVSFDPWNSNEDIAISCKDFFDCLNIPEIVLEEIEQNQCDFQVYKYLKGDLNARQRPAINDISDLTELTRKWLNSHFFYYSMEQLADKIG